MKQTSEVGKGKETCKTSAYKSTSGVKVQLNLINEGVTSITKWALY